MAIEDVERAVDISRQYVDVDNILADFSNTNLSTEEKQEAALAIHAYRAQEIANMAAIVLLSKKEELLEKRLNLLGEIGLIDIQLGHIDSSATGHLESSGDSLFDEVSERVKQRFLAWNGLRPNQLRNEAEKVKPFALTIPLRNPDRWYVGGKPVPDYNLIEWAESHKELLDKVCGGWAKNSFIRVAYSFARAYCSQERLDNLAEVNDLGTGEVLHKDGEPVAYRLVVNKPRDFMDNLLRLTNVGTKSVTAMFCVADIQRLTEAL